MNTEQIPNSSVLSSDKYMPSYSHIIMGSGETQDAKLQDTIGQSQFAAMITAQEVDILLCTLDEDDMLAKAESFMALEQIFTPQELAELENRLIRYDASPTAYGVEITDSKMLVDIFGHAPIGVFLADNCPHPDLAKEALRSLVFE